MPIISAFQGHPRTPGYFISSSSTFYKKQNQPNKPTKHKTKTPNLKCHPGKRTMESEVEDIFHPTGLGPPQLFDRAWGWGGDQH